MRFGEQAVQPGLNALAAGLVVRFEQGDGFGAGTIARMTECIHGLEAKDCGTCNDASDRRNGSDGSMVGKSFALVFAPGLCADTFIHLNREGDHWKFRRYLSPNRPPTELAQSGKSSRLSIDIKDVRIVHEISYPYSTSLDGVSVANSRYWFDEIEKANAAMEVLG